MGLMTFHDVYFISTHILLAKELLCKRSTWLALMLCMAKKNASVLISAQKLLNKLRMMHKVGQQAPGLGIQQANDRMWVHNLQWVVFVTTFSVKTDCKRFPGTVSGRRHPELNQLPLCFSFPLKWRLGMSDMPNRIAGLLSFCRFNTPFSSGNCTSGCPTRTLRPSAAKHASCTGPRTLQSWTWAPALCSHYHQCQYSSIFHWLSICPLIFDGETSAQLPHCWRRTWQWNGQRSWSMLWWRLLKKWPTPQHCSALARKETHRNRACFSMLQYDFELYSSQTLDRHIDR